MIAHITVSMARSSPFVVSRCDATKHGARQPCGSQPCLKPHPGAGFAAGPCQNSKCVATRASITRVAGSVSEMVPAGALGQRQRAAVGAVDARAAVLSVRADRRDGDAGRPLLPPRSRCALSAGDGGEDLVVVAGRDGGPASARGRRRAPWRPAADSGTSASARAPREPRGPAHAVEVLGQAVRHVHGGGGVLAQRAAEGRGAARAGDSAGAGARPRPATAPGRGQPRSLRSGQAEGRIAERAGDEQRIARPRRVRAGPCGPRHRADRP